MAHSLMKMLVIVFLALATSAQAQMGLNSSGSGAETTEVAPEDMSAEAINAMVARMSDDEVRALLLERLDAADTQDAAPEAAATMLDRAAQLWSDLTSPFMGALGKLPSLPGKMVELFGNFLENQGGFGNVAVVLGLVAMVLAAGLAAEYATRVFVLRSSHLDVEETDPSLKASLTLLFKRFVRELFGLIVFYFVIRTLGRIVLTPDQLAFAGPFVAYVIWMPRLAGAFSRFLLAPRRADLRLVNATDKTARFLHRHIVGLFLLGGFTLFFVGFGRANGVPSSETGVAFWLDTLVYVYIAYIAWTARAGLSDLMRGNNADRTAMEERFALAYPYFMIAVALATWVLVNVLVGRGQVGQLLQGAHYFTMVLLFIAPVIDTAVRALVYHLMAPMSGEGLAAEAAYKSTQRSFINIGRVVSAGVLIVLIARAWNFKISALLQDGAGIADNLFSFLMTLVVGYIVYEGVSLWINMRLAAERTSQAMSEEDADNEIAGASGSRLSTVLPLALLSAKTAIIVIFALLALGNLGIDITPLMAGAGIAGLAIGFGAQKLVTDVVSGVFFLVDDAFRVGEYVDVGGTMGAVEKISIRSMQLRHHNGPVHTIPYGEISKLTNFSRDWVIMKLKFTVPFDTDPNKVKKIFKRIGQELLENPLFEGDILQPFKSQGVADFNDLGMVIRGKFMAKPGKQFMIRKEIYNQVKAYFKEAGIDFARREVHVALDDHENGAELTDAEKATVKGAAAAAVQQQDEAPASAPKGPDG